MSKNKKLQAQIKTQNDEIVKLNQILKEKEKQIKSLTQDLIKEKRLTEQLNIKIEEKERKIQKYEDKEKEREENEKEPIQQTHKEMQIIDSEMMDKIEKIKELGKSASGTAYEVSRTIIEKQICVLKVMTNLKQENFHNFLREYEILNSLDHPNVLKTYGIFLSNETTPPSILLEHCSSDIGQAIKENQISKTDAVCFIYQIAEGMKYVHFQKIIHRDLKPSNIFISFDKTAKIGDFGISKIISSKEQTSMTGALGTLFFMAPEVANNENYDEKCDVYSFGVLMFYILSKGEMPKLTLSQYAQGIKANIPSTFTCLSKDLINSCWNFNPKNRPSFKMICEKIERNEYNLLELTDDEMEEVKTRISQNKKKVPRY